MDQFDKAIYAIEKALKKLTNKSYPCAILTEYMTTDEAEMEILAAYLKEGIPLAQAEAKAKKDIAQLLKAGVLDVLTTLPCSTYN